jgi:hypothetical protein
MNYNITEQTFESHYSGKNPHIKDEPEDFKLFVKDYDHLEFDIKGKFNEKNNIFKEIEILKEKEKNNVVDYISVLRISGKKFR